jgi:hypothetical protein
MTLGREALTMGQLTDGWQQSAARDMEDDAVAMARQGYRVVASGEYGIPCSASPTTR